MALTPRPSASSSRTCRSRSERRGALGAHPADHRLGEAHAGERQRCDRGLAGGADHAGGRCVLADEARGAGVHRGEQLLVAGVHGQHDEADLRLALRSARTTSRPVPSGSRTSVTTTSGAAPRPGPALGDRGRLAGDVETVGLGEGAGETLTDQLVVVDQQHGGHGHPGSSPASSRQASRSLGRRGSRRARSRGCRGCRGAAPRRSARHRCSASARA